MRCGVGCGFGCAPKFCVLDFRSGRGESGEFGGRFWLRTALPLCLPEQMRTGGMIFPKWESAAVLWGKDRVS